MIVADTDFRHQAMGDILPLRDVFVSFFFVSLGMFFDFEVLMEKPDQVGWLLLAFIGGKSILAILAASLIAFTPSAWLARVGLAQFGEFGFVLLQLATQEGVVSDSKLHPFSMLEFSACFLPPFWL